ncbi:MAG TPA: HAMP domain-containing sensor histidine kinase [Gaiellaceae bacterium]|nr:HAMP domain-containing sensor histidine kinase [Gaiellaceae bacterium]
MRRLGLRHRLLLAVVAAVTVALAGLVLGFNLVLGHTLDNAARDRARTRAAAQLDLLTTRNGRLTVRETTEEGAVDAHVWIFSGGSVLEHPRSTRRVDAAARALAGGPARYVDVRGRDVRLYAAPVVIGGRRVGTVVSGVSLAPYEQTRNVALTASLAFGAIVLLLVVVVAHWLVGSSLRPVRRMTRQATAWSEHDLDHRFGLGEPHDELTELASTLDQLLDRLAASLRREQRFSAELSHELRTPLARVLAESELALRRDRTPEQYRDALTLIQANAAQLTRTVNALMAAARHEAGSERGTADAYDVAEEAAAGLAQLASERDLDVRVVRPPSALRVGVDLEYGERILQPLLDNACRYGAKSVNVTIDRANGGVRYTIEDDGPGLDADERDRIFEPGMRGSASRGDDGGAGLGLALARRLARSVSGDVAAVDGDGGARFVVTLPRA